MIQYIVRDSRTNIGMQDYINSKEDAQQLANAIKRSAISRGDPETANHIVVEEIY